jgi:hypothetical protein
VGAAAPVKPYYLPWRALTSADAPNLVLAGKSMAATFFANAATRLHPEEWVTGTAAGLGAALMVGHGWSTADVYDNVALLQAELTAVGQPLNWTLPWPPAAV